MSEKQMKLTYDLDKTEVALTIVRATGLMGARRINLSIQGDKFNRANPGDELGYYRVNFYPDCICCVIEAVGIPWPIDFDTFMGLPDELLNKWASMVYDLNPHFLPTPSEAGKKENGVSEDPKGQRSKKP